MGKGLNKYPPVEWSSIWGPLQFKTLKGECIRVKTPLSLEDARRLVAEFVTYYNTVRFQSAIADVTPADKLAGRAEAIWAARKQKLAAANARRRAKPTRLSRS